MTPSTAHAVGATAADAPLAPLQIERRACGSGDVRIEISYCGVCHSDIHFTRGEWGEIPYPAIPGHEITGIVAEVGADVTRFAPGDRVGVGCMVNSCRECDNCVAGEEQYCLRGNTQTYGSVDRDGTITYGGYSSHVVVDQDFVLRIPDGLALDVAAPLLCAGVTTWSPLRHWGAGPGRRVAVVGLGGLGHMAVKFAKALGAEVTVLSQSLRKQEDGLRLGADAYYATSDRATFGELAGRFDLIVNTVSAPLSMGRFLRLLKTDGAFVNVGAPPEPLAVPVFALIGQRRTFAGSAIGSIRETQEMLDFCAEHAIGAEIELIGADRINEAWERVLASDVRYRFVIDSATLGG
ncbi:NAD(P)-dependent alcohol dehydrogenase [Conexibacter sp. JD483]|uniref:NAD(P)-dependent alcohol dehydrogenase n=1 Tax=unclassified Conexibacter TaxID=2627773 RepID=UPI002718888A|nr:MULTISPECIES: NAD(P)-dependent alcohol dehydrogenase [unclassified Conexibacter]MDO8188751.1 NAD(P)-dependent alcohol dehydrogenase [Conexibacter sp. CPCC 205706]MDO8199903.1 NAD(P)-dependent alcohol dehydrogenase [Conexibacter sp. CPCC 205762]MDR9371164.1 NAD(P)-dependent alcohol dehydrogenase [Conexibacter sp. JD483]